MATKKKATKTTKPEREDFNQAAFRIVRQATTPKTTRRPSKRTK